MLLLTSVAHQGCLVLAINHLCILPLALVLKLFGLLRNFSELPCSPVRHTWTPKEGGPMFRRAWADETPLSSCFEGCSCCVSQHWGVYPGSLALRARESSWREGERYAMETLSDLILNAPVMHLVRAG